MVTIITRGRLPGAFMCAGTHGTVGVSASVTVMDRSGLPSATAAGIGAAGGVRHAATPIAMGTGMGVGLGTGQVTGQAVEIPAVIICIVHNATRHAPGPNLPRPTKGRELHVLRPTGLTMFMLTGTAMSTVRQTRDGSSAPIRVGSRKTERPRPSSKGIGRLRPSSKERGNSRPSSLTAANRHGSRATKEPTVIISPAAAAAAEAVAVEAVAVEVAVVGAVAVVANNLSQ